MINYDMKCNVGVLAHVFLIKYNKKNEKFDDRPFVRFLPPRPFFIDFFDNLSIVQASSVWLFLSIRHP